MGKTELPTGFGDVGSLLDLVIRLDIPSCGTPTIVEHQGVHYIQPSQDCPPEIFQRRTRAHKKQVEALARKHGVPIDRKNVGVTIDRLRKKQDVHVPEPHSCQTGVLWLGLHHSTPRRGEEAADDRPSWIVDAEQRLTKYPYAVLFSLLDLVTEAPPGETLDPWVAPEKVLEWCTMYGLPDTETSHRDERYGCLQLYRFQAETVNLYLLFHLWKALIEWQVFKEVLEPSDPEEAERHREAIHHYASLLLMLHNGGSLGHHIEVEQWVKQRLDRGIYGWVNPHTNEVVNDKQDALKAYTGVKADVDQQAQVAIDDEIDARSQRHVYLSGAAAQIIMRAPSAFDACYFQLGQLRLKPPGEIARHLKHCAVPSCGRVFWTNNDHTKFCGHGNHNRKAQHIAQKRAKARPQP